MLLTDQQLAGLTKANPSFITGVDASSPLMKGSQIQAASIDLTAGKIYVPETPHDAPGGVNNPRDSGMILKAGETAVVQTAERLEMPSNLAAFGFPPARMSRNGVLMTNPGHVDPGYRGYLSFTIINMGKADYEIKAGAPIVTLLFFELQSVPGADWSARGNAAGDKPVSLTTLDRLTHDFLEVEARAKAVADEAERETRRLTNRATWISGLALLLIPVITLVVSAWVGSWSSVSDLDKRVTSVEQTIKELELDTRLDRVEQQLTDIINTSG